MIDLIKQIESFGLTVENYEKCLKDIHAKINGKIDMEWAEIVSKYNLNIHYDTLRKASQTIFGGAFVSEYMQNKRIEEEASDGYIRQLRAEKQELRKERQKNQDERNELQRLLREQARKESFVDLIKRTMEKTVEPVITIATPNIDSDDDMIIVLSDIHAGIEVDNTFNRYDMLEVAGRLGEYISAIAYIQETHNCKEAHIVLGGDMISGLIHPNLRLQNNENVIEQLKVITIYIGNFVKAIATLFERVNVYSVSGNHSRLSPQKEEHLRGEELDALIPFYLKIMFENCHSIQFPENEIDDYIASFVTRGNKLFYAVHGDKDSPKSAVKNLTLMTGQKPDAIIMGHRHHNSLISEHGVKVISCGSVVGVDDYCLDHRITGRAEQCVIITNERCVVKCLYDVGLTTGGVA